MCSICAIFLPVMSFPRTKQSQIQFSDCILREEGKNQAILQLSIEAQCSLVKLRWIHDSWKIFARTVVCLPLLRAQLRRFWFANVFRVGTVFPWGPIAKNVLRFFADLTLVFSWAFCNSTNLYTVFVLWPQNQKSTDTAQYQPCKCFHHILYIEAIVVPWMTLVFTLPPKQTKWHKKVPRHTGLQSD